MNWTHLVAAATPLLIVLFLRTLLDFRLAQFIVKNFYWVPVRSFLRKDPASVKGDWEQIWEPASSEAFKAQKDRHGHTTLRQLGIYCYAEFMAKGTKYVLFGRVVGCYLVGDWYDKRDPLGYFGAFQLEIISAKNMTGRWIGHSKTTHVIDGDQWTWTKLG